MEQIENEVWKPVVDWEPLYEVSNIGRVRSKDRIVKCNTGTGVKKSKEIKPRIDRYGYVAIALTIKDRKLQTGVHRLVAKAFISNPDNKESVNHINGIKTDNRVENLEWCTNQENSDHAVRIGLKNGNWEIGENNPGVKLSEIIVLEIRKLYIEGMKQVDIGKLYDIDTANIHCIVRRKSWKHI